MIKIERPPNWDQILEAFPSATKHGVLFAYGEDVYNPSGVRIPEPVLAHEYRHCSRQFNGRAERWWHYYINDPQYRYDEELLGHVDELKVLLNGARDRNMRHKLLMRTATRLVAPLYNYTPPRSLPQAMRDLSAHF